MEVCVSAGNYDGFLEHPMVFADGSCCNKRDVVSWPVNRLAARFSFASDKPLMESGLPYQLFLHSAGAVLEFVAG
jgi:hypothetical protein